MTRLAILIDADNISSKMMERIMLLTAPNGEAVVRRIYGDWSHPQLAAWKCLVLEYAFQPMQQYRYALGKNATDAALIIDAMDLLYSGAIDVFCLVSSDSDFTRLALRLREAGKMVIGLGNSQAPQAYRVACTKFIELDKNGSGEAIASAVVKAPLSEKRAKKGKKKSPSQELHDSATSCDLPEVDMICPEEEDEHAIHAPFEVEAVPNREAKRSETEDIRVEAEALFRSLVNRLANGEGWANLGEIGAEIFKMKPRPRFNALGRRKLIEQIRMFPCFEIALRKETKVPLHYVRLVDDDDVPF